MKGTQNYHILYLHSVERERNYFVSSCDLQQATNSQVMYITDSIEQNHYNLSHNSLRRTETDIVFKYVILGERSLVMYLKYQWKTIAMHKPLPDPNSIANHPTSLNPKSLLLSQVTFMLRLATSWQPNCY